MKQLIIPILLVICIVSCSEKEPGISGLNKAHSIEVSLATKKLNDTAEVLITQQNVYVKGRLVKSILRSDTIPALGDSLQNVEEDNGYEHAVMIPKEYEFFVTVK